MNSTFDKNKALLIILGASDYPKHDKYSKRPMKPAEISVQNIKDFFEKKDSGLELEEDHIKTLFNLESNRREQLDEIKSFLKKNQPEKEGDVFIYYVGHGEVYKNELHLSIKDSISSDNNIDFGTYISIEALFNHIREGARNKRYYIILDTCHAGAIRKTVPDTPHGTVCFCCSSALDTCDFQTDDRSSSEQPTLFTSSLLKVLNGERVINLPTDQSHLSCNDINSFLDKYLINHSKLKPQYYVIGKRQSIIGNLKIFPNPAYVQEKTNSRLLYPVSVAEKLSPIKWHITTSNKGGVGKTLLSMMLLTHYSTNRPEDKAAIKKLPLVVDLNGVNMDIKRLLGNRDLELEQDGQIKRVNLGRGDTSLAVVKVNQKNHPFLLGWSTVDPFKMLDAPSFFKLLEVIKGEAISKIKEKFPKVDISVVIIDTNYHFCNIFSDDNTHYEYLKEFLWERDQFFIWFIWVYGQLRNLIQGDSPSDELIEKQRMESVSEQVEAFLAPVTGGQRESPFFHVLNPIGLKNDQNTTNIGINGIIERTANNLKFLMWGGEEEGGVKEGDVPGKRIDKLDKLLKLDLKGGKNFVDIQENMISALEQAKPKAQTKGGKKKEELVFAEHERTQQVLLKLEEILKADGGRPKNLVPIPIYHEQLESYQDAEHISLSAIRRLEVYTEFRDLLNKATKK